MLRVWLCIFLIGAAVFENGCSKPAVVETPPPALEIDPKYGHLLHAQAKLPTIKVLLGDQVLTTEIASRQVEIATGMMFRTNIPENEAMLFVFADAAPRSFYMRNCFVPLSAAYMDTDGRILQEIDMQPHDETGIPSAADNIQFVLEVPQGWFARHGIRTNTVVRTERGSLAKVFLW